MILKHPKRITLSVDSEEEKQWNSEFEILRVDRGGQNDRMNADGTGKQSNLVDPLVSHLVLRKNLEPKYLMARFSDLRGKSKPFFTGLYNGGYLISVNEIDHHYARFEGLLRQSWTQLEHEVDMTFIRGLVNQASSQPTDQPRAERATHRAQADFGR